MIKISPIIQISSSVITAAVLLFLSNTGLSQVSGKEALEQKLSSKLDRILNTEEYVLDIKLKSDVGSATAPADSFLPGLQVLGPFYDSMDSSGRTIILGGVADLLLILDKKVSSERAQVARDIVIRTLEAEGLNDSVKVSTQRRNIKKTPDPLPNPPPPPPPPREPSFFEQLVREKELLSRVLLVFWGGVVSLMAIYFLLRRVLIPPSQMESSPQANPIISGSRAMPPTEAPGQPPKHPEKTRGEIYSKDEALLSSIKEITEESRSQPQKTARILSRWVSQSTELSRAAALYLRNCDIKTVELVCQAMHPSDLEKIISNKIEDFEPFGPENQRVIERMRADLAILASEVVLRERPDPLSFLKKLSDEEIRELLDGETEETVALVASQLPAHRLQKYYDSVPADAMKEIISKLSSLKSASVSDFESLQELLNDKFKKMANNLVNEKDLLSSIQATIRSLASPRLQCDLAEKLRRENLSVYEKVRPSILLPTDLSHLPGRIKSLMIQSIDADTLGMALAGLDLELEQLMDGLPPAYQSVFLDTYSRPNDTKLANDSWRRVSVVMEELVAAGLMSQNEVIFTIRRAEEFKIDHHRQNDENAKNDNFNPNAA